MAEEDGEWKTVTSTDKKRVIRKGGSRNRRIIDPETHGQFILQSKTGIEDQQDMQECIEKCMEYLAQTDFHQSLLQAIEKVAKDSNQDTVECQEIVCYGIGNYSLTSLTHFGPSLWQLSCALALRADCEGGSEGDSLVAENHTIPLTFYDPCTNAFEKEFILQKLKKCEVPDMNDRGIRTINESSPYTQEKSTQRIVLFFMPHCPAKLYENVVWSNWSNLISSGSSVRIVILGNSLSSLADPLAGINRPACPCIKTLLPWLQEIPLVTSKKDIQQAPGSLLRAFNDTYISYWIFQKCDIFPVRPYDSIKDDDEDKELL